MRARTFFTHSFRIGPIHVTVQIRRLKDGSFRPYLKNLHFAPAQGR